MSNQDFQFRELYKKILLGLLTIENFSYINNFRFIQIVNIFLNKNSSFKTSKDSLISALNETELNYIPDSVILDLMEYENPKKIQLLHSNKSSFLNSLSTTEKTICLVFEFCYNSILKEIIEPSYEDDYSSENSSDFDVDDFILLNQFILNKSKKQVEECIKNLTKKGVFIYSKEEDTLYYTLKIKKELELEALFNFEEKFNKNNDENEPYMKEVIYLFPNIKEQEIVNLALELLKKCTSREEKLLILSELEYLKASNSDYSDIILYLMNLNNS